METGIVICPLSSSPHQKQVRHRPSPKKCSVGEQINKCRCGSNIAPCREKTDTTRSNQIKYRPFANKYRPLSTRSNQIIKCVFIWSYLVYLIVSLTPGPGMHHQGAQVPGSGLSTPPWRQGLSFIRGVLVVDRGHSRCDQSLA